jgi:hypothetical protein
MIDTHTFAWDFPRLTMLLNDHITSVGRIWFTSTFRAHSGDQILGWHPSPRVFSWIDIQYEKHV